MLRELFSNRLFIGALAFFILCVVGGTLYIAYIERQGIEDGVSETEKPIAPLAEKPKPPPPGETADGGHWHSDEWHADPHETEPAVPAVVNTAPAVPRGEPFANFTPDPNEDPIAAAYRRLDYIANNLHEWGNFSPRTLQLIDELTPIRVEVEGEGGLEIELLTELCELRDPRSAETLVSYQVDSAVNGWLPNQTLVAMGPASVPALVARLDETPDKALLYTPIRLLPRIVAEHRLELGGIVEHIIIPKLQRLVMFEGDPTNGYITSNKFDAREALAELQQ